MSYTGSQTASGTVPNFVSTHIYVGSASGGCYGAAPTNNEVESIAFIVESCGSTDVTTLCPQHGTAPSGAAGCVPEYYISTTLIECDISAETTWYDSSYSNDETGFLHTGSPTSPTNRIGAGIGGSNKCPSPTGGTTPNSYYYWTNPSDQQGAQNWLSAWFENGTIAGRGWVWTFLDNNIWYRPTPTGALPTEFPTLASWRQAQGKFASYMSDEATNCMVCQPRVSGTSYAVEPNAVGPGGGNFGPNNATPQPGSTSNSEGTVNESADISDFCYGKNTQTSGLGFGGDGSDPGLSPAVVSERPWEEGNGTRLLSGGNPKILINTASQLFGQSPPGGVNYLCPGGTVNSLDILNAADTIALRMVTKAMEFIMTPDWYSGGFTTLSWQNVNWPTGIRNGYNTPIIEWRYNIGTTQGNASSATQEVAIFPEDELVMVNPMETLGYFSWSGSGDGGGCAGVNVLSNDAGGTHAVTLQRSCGAIGTWDGGFYAPVYLREGTCYRLGALLGPCAAAISMATTASASFVLKQSDFTNGASYHHYLNVSGGELGTDPITNQPICLNSNANCDGNWGEAALTGSPWSYTLPSCAPSDLSTKYENSADCAVILLP